MHRPSARTLREATPEYLAEVRRSNQAEADFLARYGLRYYRLLPWHVRKILGSGGAHADAVAFVVSLYFADGHRLPFDHACVLGRDRRPVVIVAHPYPYARRRLVHPGTEGLLAAVAKLGVSVELAGPEKSFYGFGTVHIRIGALPPAVNGPDLGA